MILYAALPFIVLMLVITIIEKIVDRGSCLRQFEYVKRRKRK